MKARWRRLVVAAAWIYNLNRRPPVEQSEAEFWSDGIAPIVVFVLLFEFSLLGLINYIG